MTTAKSPRKTPTKKKIVDVKEPGKTTPSSTSKPVIVTNRPILKDPMVTPEAAKPVEIVKPRDDEDKLKHSTGPAVKPLGASSDSDSDDPKTAEAPSEATKTDSTDEEPKATPDKESDSESEAETEPEVEAKAKPEVDAKTEEEDKSTKKTAQNPEAKAAEQAQHDAAVQKLVDSKKYELPINAVEKRKTKRFIVLGVFLAILLALAWADVAADAGLVHVNGVKPVTHFFSN